MKNKKHITIEKVILFLAASFAAYNFGLAGGFIEGTHFSFGGLVAGVVVNVSIAVASSRFGSLKGVNRTRQAGVAFWGMMMLSPVLVAPAVFYSLPETFLGGGWLRGLWSVGWALAADLAIVLAGAVSGKGLIALSEESTSTVTASASKVRKNAKQEAQSVAVKTKYPHKCEHCEEMIRTPQSVGAHMKKHHPELCKPKALAVGLFENVQK